MMNNWIAYGVASILVALTAVSGSYFTYKNVQSKWYQCIQPSWTPPRMVFPIVWTILYIAIAISLARILASSHILYDNLLLFAFLLNLILNTTWCYFYFAKKDIFAALMTIFCLSLTIGVIILRTDDTFVQCSMLAYAAWIAFATALNFASLFKARACLSLQ